MSQLKHISPLLDGLAIGSAFFEKAGVACYPAQHRESGVRYIVKQISIPESPVQFEALLLSGAVNTENAAAAFFQAVSDDLCNQVQILEKLSQHRYFQPFAGHQVVPHEDGIGCEVYLLSEVGITLSQWMKHRHMTQLEAVNLGIDLCAALAVSREMGYLYANLNPNNIFVNESHRFSIGDLGFIRMDELHYKSLPSGYLSDWTPPEVMDMLSTPNTTMDTYSLGMLLYQIFNDGQLPFLAGEPYPQELAPPAYADFRMGRLILKAIAQDPAQRYADPMEMGRMLLTYTQRIKVRDIPIIHQARKGDSEEDAVPDAIPEVEEPEAAEEAEPITEAAPVAEAAPEENVPQEEAAPLEEPAEPANRNTLVLEFSAEQSGIPEKEPEELPFEIPDYVFDQVPDPFEFPLDEEDFILREPEPVAVGALAAEQDEAGSAPADAVTPTEQAIDEILHAEPVEASQEAPETASKKPWKNRLVKVGWSMLLILLVLLAAGSAGGYYYYQNIYTQSIDALELNGSADKLIVELFTNADNALLNVVCQGADGSTQRAQVIDGHANFADLAPNTAYTISVEISGRHRLIGTTAETYTSPGRAEISGLFAVTGAVDGSAIIGFQAEGDAPENWTLSYQAPDEEERQVRFNKTTATVTGLQVGKEYTFTLQGDDSCYLVGDTQTGILASNLLLAQELAITNFAEGNLTAAWKSPEGSQDILWHLQLLDSEGGEITRDTQETTAVFKDLNPELTYTLVVLADGMTKNTTASVSSASPALTDMQFTAHNGTNLQVTWDATGNTPENWKLVYTLDGGSPVTLATESNSVRVAPAAPGGHYEFKMLDNIGRLVLNSSFSYDMPESKNFRSYRLKPEDFSAQMFPTPEKENWNHQDVDADSATTEFAPGKSASLLLKLKPRVPSSRDSITTVTVIRSAEGQVVSLGSITRSWNAMWDDHYSTVDLPKLPEAPGTYTAAVYFNGAFVLETDLTIT